VDSAPNTRNESRQVKRVGRAFTLMVDFCDAREAVDRQLRRGALCRLSIQAGDSHGEEDVVALVPVRCQPET
jgi:hypothetical protein